ncbi:acyl-CoA dehydrogenase family protein [Deinococcus radiodurans]|jgi:Acyl-CoA dehydrogenases|nr:acyl-CoA dehydrogenase family protein [Deinococcus radiodurans]ANC72207.1 acyl-CoA dehydrogenase [Deinococcus radiodurans R1 = ATCC 13939 = DSM 20539]QIP28727.1 acyl-CoA dehydrogenase [Deinococcus radiodurans]QIP32569.1 acyl-CoA dehydrogenase [Deinococcus radiodurans]UID69553.1 acyl-CoA dehydrogenase [Deinococcus radiodurans R1 = ATCC 13939 = DSM 20539]
MENNTPDLNELMARIDLGKLGALAGKVDLASILNAASNMNDKQLKQLSRALGVGGSGRQRVLPAADGDYYDYLDTLTDSQVEVAGRVHDFMRAEVMPIMNEYWSRDEFPRDLIGKMRELNLLRSIWNEDGTRKPDATLIEGVVILEACRVDVSTAVFFGVHGGLATASIALGSDEEQKKRWLPDMLDMKKIGAFGLTEPEGGSQVSEGMRTTCRRDGDGWVLNGEKKWIGNSTFSDFTVIWARDEETNEVRGFVVEAGTPGYDVEKIQGKIALRMVENGHITLKDCRVADANRLQAVQGWETVSQVLKLTRAGVAWQGVGCAMGAYELALAYTQTRKQFGKRIGEFQLIQSHLTHMLADVTAMLGMVMRLSHIADEGRMDDAHAALAKVHTAARCREVVARAREVFGGNGILLEHGVAKHFCDTEAIYSYEGTNEINTLVVGRAITGLSAFV